jgi:hypothetical protein
VTPSRADEAAHAAGPGTWWSDAWHLDATTREGIGLSLRLECYPNQRTAWFWTYLVLPDLTGPVVVRDHEVPLPRQGLEVRAEGLWCELWCETPLEHWTYGLEAFAVNLEAPEDALTGEIGERVAIGLDLEWEIDGPIHPHPDGWPVAGYVAPGIVHGDVLLGRERFELDARGAYHRTWGERDWHSAGAWAVTCTGPDLGLHVFGTPNGVVDGVVRFGSDAPRVVTRIFREGSAGAARIVIEDEIEIEIDPLMGAPVPIDDRAYVDRALCRVRAGDATAMGWSSEMVER